MLFASSYVDVVPPQLLIRAAPQMLNFVDIIVGFETIAHVWDQANNQGICPQPSFITVPGDPGYCSGTSKEPLYCTSNGKLCKCATTVPFESRSQRPHR